ncbi:hypothetical protein ACIOHH_33480 [Streptomyces microflavus]|uniref:hypothetical protein n=1 Tax=Streptomyces microflavus TaxID=1919 RepID=UPI0038050186
MPNFGKVWHQRVLPDGAKPSAGAEELDFPPIPNGIDYLVSVVKHLHPDTGGTPRDIKYAVLHLQAAAEVLLKARLSHEHWSLVFKDPAKANWDDVADASFESCTTTAAVERLRNIASLPITKKNADALADLAKDRNRLQHYGLTHNAKAVESRAATVLDFLMDFLDGALVPQLTQDEAAFVAPQMALVRDGLSAIQSFVTKRMNRLRGEVLKGSEERTLRCPDCNQLALLASDASGGFCHFCDQAWTADDLAYALQSHPTGSQLNECPDCHGPTLTDSAEFADTRVTLYCTTCAVRFDSSELRNCAACGCYCREEALPETGQILCTDCQERILREEHERYWR